jgi:hypothetical protein
MQATHLFFFVCIEIPEDTYIFVGMTYFFVASLKKKKVSGAQRAVRRPGMRGPSVVN